ncbi:MAG: hypothetical protein ACRCTI_09250 [Beijerinckiaceae bacterium]
MKDFWTLREIDLSTIPAKGWNDYFAAMEPWLRSDDVAVRTGAVERLSMAVFRAEPMVVPYRERGAAHDAHLIARMEWLLGSIAQAQARHPDAMPAFLDNLRHHGDDHPFDAPLARWLAAIEADPPAGVDPNQALGIRLLVQPFADLSAAMACLIPVLDHEAAYPRACAARRLSDLTEDEAIALVVEKELARPGVLGPFWSPRYDLADHPEKTLWLLDILERRNGKAPADLPFNDIDFYLHELCSTSPALVRRMMDNGFEELAWLTATEHAAPIEGMEPILRDLALSADPRIAGSAARHLANQYGPDAPRPQVTHPRP